MLNLNLTVKKKLGEGGQGTVYLVEGSHGPQAIKWYNLEQSTEEQKQSISSLVRTGPPQGVAGQRFIWPLDLVTLPNEACFGYLMPLIDTSKFVVLGEVQAHLKPAPGFQALCEISYQAANSYRALHLTGHCYRDISAGNLMFDTKKGEVLICDNDNVGVNRQSESQVWGTMEYMAPEVVRKEANPSTETDLHSLAVLLFNLWVWHHPMHGDMEAKIRVWDLPAKRRIYGEQPVFIFDPHDKRNQLPSDPAYATAAKRWGFCPKSLQRLFVRAFTEGLKNPANRVTEGEWQSLFRQLKDNIISCPSDGAENVWDVNSTNFHCWHCNKAIPVPPKLVFQQASGKHYLLLTHATKMLKRHINPSVSEADASMIIGQVVQNPANPQVWGIRNETSTPWLADFANGTTKEIPPQKSAPLNAGLQLNINGVKAQVIP